MRILIVSATEKEIKPLLKKLSFGKNAVGSFKKGRYKNIYVDVLITGIGMVSTAYHCAKIAGEAYDCAINIGIAGSFKKDIALGTVVNVIYDRFSELGAESGEKPGNKKIEKSERYYREYRAWQSQFH
jgi:futalosine hydrolase